MEESKSIKFPEPNGYINTINFLKNVADLKNLCDVTLVSGIDKQKFPAHRIILIASSKYFAALFGPNFREGSEKEILLDIDGPMLKIILEFIYTADIKISAENVSEIIAAASSVELLALEEKCGHFLEHNLSIANCVEVLLMADKYRLKDVWSKAFKLICDNFEHVPIENIQQIDSVNFQEVIKHDQITAAETIVLDRLVQWMDYNKIGTSKVATDMLKLIRLAHIPIAALTGSVERFYDKYDCAKIVVDEYRMRLLNNKAIVLHRYIPQAIFCSFGNSTSNGIDIKKYDFAENNWNEFKNVSFGARRIYFGSIVMNGELYVMGGYDGNNSFLNIVESYDLENLTKTSLPNMASSRSRFTPIPIGKYIYAIGGYNEKTIDACERYDTVNRVWQPRQKLPSPVYYYAFVEFDRHIYIIGGSNSSGTSQKLYCYCPDINAWTEKSYSACLKGSKFGLAKSKQFIYAMEFYGAVRVHQYEPARDTWTLLGSFDNTVDVSRCLNYRNQLYVV